MRRDVIIEAVRLMQAGEPFVLATVTKTTGMTPQKAGARQIITADGGRVGTLGGGCVEGDIWWYAREILQEKSEAQYRSYKLNADLAAQDGLVCGGTMYFYLEPVWQQNRERELYTEVLAAFEDGPPVSLATVVNDAEAEIGVGRKMLLRSDDSTFDAFADESLVSRLQAMNRKLSVYGGNELLKTERGAEIYLEGFTTPPTLVIMGGGHVGHAVYKLALNLGFRVCIVDDREDFANKERFPDAWRVIASDYDAAVRQMSLGPNSFILIATRGHRYDDIATHAAVATPARYIGLLGSRRKNLLIFRELLADGVARERLEDIHAPVGLNIGAVTPQELAVSIVAEVVMCLRGGDGRPMKASGALGVDEL